MGIGVPQYLCLDMSQSRSLYWTVFLPQPFFCRYLVMSSLTFVLVVPENFPEWTRTPESVYARVISLGSRSKWWGFMTTFMGILYFFANMKSLWSCAGTAIMAPVPYSSSTKLA